MMETLTAVGGQWRELPWRTVGLRRRRNLNEKLLQPRGNARQIGGRRSFTAPNRHLFLHHGNQPHSRRRTIAAVGLLSHSQLTAMVGRWAHAAAESSGIFISRADETGGEAIESARVRGYRAVVTVSPLETNAGEGGPRDSEM